MAIKSKKLAKKNQKEKSSSKSSQKGRGKSLKKEKPIKIETKEEKVKKSIKNQEKKTLLLFCPRCKRETDNVITGFIGQKIRRVRCEVCKSEHNYHRIQALKKRMEEERTSDLGQSKEHLTQQNYYRIWEELMLGRDPQTARKYNLKEKFFENDLIDHPVFGIGVVKRVLEDYKIEVVFKNDMKVLAHNRFLAKK
ncbi:MAG: hypothetical protein N2746_03110 [Deltaproteobacteria bacterium]|nr:hypothetical protein [Deltaproteobacteria bacterium]